MSGKARSARRLRHAYCARKPPSTGSVCPVISRAWSDARKEHKPVPEVVETIAAPTGCVVEHLRLPDKVVVRVVKH